MSRSHAHKSVYAMAIIHGFHLVIRPPYPPDLEPLGEGVIKVKPKYVSFDGYFFGKIKYLIWVKMLNVLIK